jgi:hypothetical protein
VVLLATISLAGTAGAEGDLKLESRAEASLGGELYFIDSPYDNDNLGGFWDQYRHTRKKNNRPAHFFDLLHFDLGLAREDDTYALRAEGWSPNRNNTRVEVEGNLAGFDLDLDYRNYRSEELRYFPQGTFQDEAPPGFSPRYATQYTPDASLAEILDSNQRLWMQRSGIRGELRLRPEAMGFNLPLLDQISLRSGYQRRKGYRQDSFLLDPRERTFQDNQRFRGNRRRVDQQVTSVGGGLVLTPLDGVTTDFDVSFESFRERADVVTFQDLADADPTAIRPPSGDTGLRAFNFVPDTDRLSASMRVAGEIGAAQLQAGGFVTHLRQTNRAPLQQALGLDKQEVTSWSAHAGFDLKLGKGLALTGNTKFAERRNDLDESYFDPLDLPQIGPILRRRSELGLRLELAQRPRPGALLAAGYRYDWVDRKLRYPAAICCVLDRPLALVADDNQVHNLYLRGRARLLRRLQISGELGWEYQPERAYARDMTHSVYFEARGAYTLPRPIPLSVSLQGSVRDGHGNGLVLTGEDTRARKDLDQLQWSYNATLTAVATAHTTLSLSFVQQHDEQETPYLRTDFPRTFGSDITNLLPDPDRIHYDSHVESLALWGIQNLTDWLEMRSFASFTWMQAKIGGDNATANALEAANEVDSRILSTGIDFGFRARDGLRFDVGYRFDQYLDHHSQAPIDPDDRRHTLHFGITANLDLLERRAAN